MKPKAEPEVIVATFNAQHAIGARVRYQPVMPPRDGIRPIETTTRSEAMVSHSGKPVVFLTGIAGYVALAHVEPLP